LDEARCSTHPLHSIAACMAQRPTREAAHMPEFDPLAMGPEALAGVPRWGIGGEALHLEPWRRAMGQELCEAMTAGDGRAIPDHHDLAGHLPPPELETRDHIVSVESTVLAVAGARALGRDGAERGQLVAGPPLLQPGRLASRGSRADHPGPGREPGCIEAEKRLLLGLGPLLRAGQVSSRQRARAVSSRCRARRAGCCGLQRSVFSTRPPGTGGEDTPHARRITAAIRPQVHTGPRQPSASAPRCNSSGRRASWSAVNRRGAPEGG
jgi:hypothetical protein